MAETAREYLIHRFRGDATALHDRVAALRTGATLPGPDESTSRRMADACTHVASLIEAVGAQETIDAELAALTALLPTLEHHARDSAASPAVRAVYAGAATRIREVEAAEAKARSHAESTAEEDAP